MNFKVIVLAVGAALLTACQGVQHNTPSGRPEVTISAPAKDVKTAFVGTLLNLGYALKRDSDFQIVVERPVDNVMANVLMGSNYDPTVEARITATIMEMGGSTRVTTDIGIVRNGGSAFEAVNNFNSSQDSLRLQALLQDIKTGLEAGNPVQDVVAATSSKSIARRAGTDVKKAPTATL